MAGINPYTDSHPEIEEEHDLHEPPMFRVIMHNDHYTSMDFVVEMLVKVFHKNEEEAQNIMLSVHRRGSGMCGVFTKDIALTKVHTVHSLAKERGFPLRCSAEEA